MAEQRIHGRPQHQLPQEERICWYVQGQDRTLATSRMDDMKMKCCLILLVMFHVGRLDAGAQSRRIIIDCDPGIDDAMAIILAMQYSGFDIVGITTVFGNASLDQATRNALTVVELSGRKIPVYKGAAKPLHIKLEPPPDFVHGKDGLGKYESACPDGGAAPPACCSIHCRYGQSQPRANHDSRCWQVDQSCRSHEVGSQSHQERQGSRVDGRCGQLPQ
jgi:hypothetical protein